MVQIAPLQAGGPSLLCYRAGGAAFPWGQALHAGHRPLSPPTPAVFPSASGPLTEAPGDPGVDASLGNGCSEHLQGARLAFASTTLTQFSEQVIVGSILRA